MANENINQTTTKEKNSFFKSLNKVFYTYSYIFSPLIVLAIFAVLFVTYYPLIIAELSGFILAPVA